jgi:hypothetical protein
MNRCHHVAIIGAQRTLNSSPLKGKAKVSNSSPLKGKAKVSNSSPLKGEDKGGGGIDPH